MNAREDGWRASNVPARELHEITGEPFCFHMGGLWFAGEDDADTCWGVGLTPNIAIADYTARRKRSLL
ncbi:MAG: hypothetical protein ACLQUT_05290 [Thermoleophilia bacterium]